jgi:hypothetical protein
MCKAFFRAFLLWLLLPAIQAAGAVQLYWNDGNTIHRAALDGSGPQNLDPTYNALGIAADQANGLFWTDDVPRVPIGPTGTIRHADLDGMGLTDVLPGIPTPIGIALDALNGKMYWTDSDNVIRRANLTEPVSRTLSSSRRSRSFPESSSTRPIIGCTSAL